MIHPLKSFMHKKRYRIVHIADAIGINRYTLSRKLNGEADFTVREIRALQKALQLTAQETYDIFIKGVVDS